MPGARRNDYARRVTGDIEPVDPRNLRISDAERHRVVEVLQQAAGEGRLSLDELSERMDVVYAAKTYGELEPVTRDLPLAHQTPAPTTANLVPRSNDLIGGTPRSTTAVAFMSGVERGGAWVVPATFRAVAVMGGVELDLREARFAEREVTIQTFAMMGGIEITVPDDITVQIEGFGFMGGFGRRGEGEGRPDGPVVRITGLAFMGGVDVIRKPRRGKKSLGSGDNPREIES